VTRRSRWCSRCRADLYSDPHGQDHLDAFEERLRDNTRSPVPDQAAFRIDYPAWLLRLGQRQREIAQDLAQDHSTGELAHRHKLSPGRISQMRRELHLGWWEQASAWPAPCWRRCFACSAASRCPPRRRRNWVW
jgi:hypothetical protein